MRSYQDIKRAASTGRAWAREHWIASFSLASLVLTGILFVPVYFLEKYVHAEASRKEMHFYYQIVTGNWSAPPFGYSKTPVIVSLSISLSIVLNLVGLGLITLAIRRITALHRENRMNHAQYESWGDAVLKSSILQEFPREQWGDVMDKLERGFRAGRSKLQSPEYLEIPFPTAPEQEAHRLHRNQDVLDPG